MKKNNDDLEKIKFNYFYLLLDLIGTALFSIGLLELLDIAKVVPEMFSKIPFYDYLMIFSGVILMIPFFIYFANILKESKRGKVNDL